MSAQRLEILILSGLISLLVYFSPGHVHESHVDRLFTLSPDDVEELVVEEEGHTKVFLRPEEGWLGGGAPEEAAFWVLWELSSLRRDLLPAAQESPRVRTLRWRQGSRWTEVGLGRLGDDRRVTLETGGRSLWAPGELLDRLRDLVPDRP